MNAELYTRGHNFAARGSGRHHHWAWNQERKEQCPQDSTGYRTAKESEGSES